MRFLVLNTLTASLKVPLFLGFLLGAQMMIAQHSVARQWNEILLNAIRRDFARPTVHARNLFHVSAAMYDAWAAYEDVATPYFLGKINHSYVLPFRGITPPSDIKTAQETAISYAAFRLIEHRFRFSPGAFETLIAADSLMFALGYDPNFSSTDYQTDNPAALGNYIAEGIIGYGLIDGANEQRNYGNTFYEPINPPLSPYLPGNPKLVDPNYWQPLSLPVFVDQSGNPVEDGGLPFLSPEWGKVWPFALTDQELTTHTKNSHTYPVYHDPGPPAYLQDGPSYDAADYKWGHMLVSIWGAHLDPADSVMWDISPGSLGNSPPLSANLTGQSYRTFYQLPEGGDLSQGHSLNPATGEPYAPNVVPRGDYTRVLAEFWADGPDSETPPGHWFTILNYVSDHPLCTKQFEGVGTPLGDLAWDVQAYFLLGGAMHDAAISAWSVKGYYDYIRPISAIRYLASLGQRTDPNLPGYQPDGIELYPGYIEVVMPGDSLAGYDDEHVGKIKLFSWRSPVYISDPETTVAGVGWILAEDWWPYQRPSFVTPPFACYKSGHSTFSRAAAEVLTLLTGDAYFPGGMGEFVAEKNEFLVFEDGPSVDVVLQWATYRDASDQTSLSRIWGGIHPPVDDLPGRLIGEQVGVDAFAHAKKYLAGELTGSEAFPEAVAFPSPIRAGETLEVRVDQVGSCVSIQLISPTGQAIYTKEVLSSLAFVQSNLTIPASVVPGIYVLNVQGPDWLVNQKIQVMAP